MPPKRPGDPSGDSPSMAAKVKLPKLEREPEDFSSVVKNKLQSYTRTGQACDRCKVRKIRCDALPQGCSHCANQKMECFVTDRVTGRTEKRGYMQQLEREKTDMLNHIRALEKVLESNGIEVKPWHWSQYGPDHPPWTIFDAFGNPQPPDPVLKDQWSQVGSAWVRNYRTRPPEQMQQLTSFANAAALEARPPGLTHLGVAADNAPLSAIKGTKLSILGTTVDITSFAAPEMDDPPAGPAGCPPTPLYNKSVQAFLQSAMGVNPPVEGVDLPPRNDAFEYAEWYFLMVYPFQPVLHKPSYLALLTRIYDDPTFRPTSAELVVVHMVFASIYFQYGARNREDYEKQTRLNDLANKHYHWCVSRFFDLAVDPSLTAVQALVMVGNYMRAFPKPGCAYLVAQYAQQKATELNLHKGSPGAADGSAITLETELRHRVWWCVLTLSVTLNGRMGRPMPTILEEFDVPFPLAVPDECLTPDGLTDRSRIGACSYAVGLSGFKIVPLYMEMYSNLYSVRRDPRRHVEVVARLEEQLRAWEDQLPDELDVDKSKGTNTHMFALYCHAYALEFRLCLRHPSACTVADPEYQAENMRICAETSRELLRHILVIHKLKSLDTTWYQTAVYVAAIFCTLVESWERRFHIAPEEVATLRREMGMWLSIIEEIGMLLGSTGLCGDISRIVEHTIAWIETDMGQNQANGSSSLTSQHHSLQAQSSAPTTTGSSPSDGSTQRAVSRTGNGNGNGNYYDAAAAAYHQISSYADHSNPVGNGAAGPGMAGYDSAGGTDGMALYGAAAAALAASASSSTADGDATTSQKHTAVAASTDPLISFASQATQLASGGSTWTDWTSSITDMQHRTGASTLLNLGTGQHQMGGVDGSQEQQHAAVGLASMASAAQQWPLLLFPDVSSVNGS
ncbi:hypothetical protein RB594_000097 [Gaeumannomyces avenae]